LSGYSAGLKIIDSDVIKDCEGDLRIPAGFALKKIDVQPMPVETIRPQTIDVQPRRSKFKEQFAYASLFCVLGAVAIYFVFKSGLWSTTPSYEQPYSPQQLVEQSTAIRSPAADEKMTSDATDDKSPSPEPPVQENRITQFTQKQDSASIELQKDKFEIVDQTLTISPDQSLPDKNELSAGNEFNRALSLHSNKSSETAALGKMVGAEPKPPLQTTPQSREGSVQVETIESSSDKIKRLIAEMAASQSRASRSEQEEGFVANKKTSEGQVPVAKEESPASVSSEIRSEPTDNVKAMPTVKPPPVQTADLNPPDSSTPSTKPVLKKEPLKQPVKKKPDKAGNKMARVETVPSSEEKTAKSRLEDRLRSFLQNYCNTYAAKNLAKFTDFFISGAQENGKPFVSLLPKYQKNFDQIEAIQYRIELQQYTYDSQNETVRIEGSFLLKWLPPDKKWRENSGKIFMNLKDDGRSFLVQRLDYYGSRQAN
jgi:hypothetical protein